LSNLKAVNFLLSEIFKSKYFLIEGREQSKHKEINEKQLKLLACCWKRRHTTDVGLRLYLLKNFLLSAALLLLSGFSVRFFVLCFSEKEALVTGNK